MDRTFLIVKPKAMPGRASPRLPKEQTTGLSRLRSQIENNYAQFENDW